MFSIQYTNGWLVVNGCTPHYRRPPKEIIEFRKQMAAQLRSHGLTLPLSRNVGVTLIARRHCDGGDLTNLLMGYVQGLVQALDGNGIGDQTDKILMDDNQIQQLHAVWGDHE